MIPDHSDFHLIEEFRVVKTVIEHEAPSSRCIEMKTRYSRVTYPQQSCLESQQDTNPLAVRLICPGVIVSWLSSMTETKIISLHTRFEFQGVLLKYGSNSIDLAKEVLLS